MTLEYVLTRFNNEGIFPTDGEMEVVVQTDESFSDIGDLELYLLSLCEENPSHPYYPMVCPIEENYGCLTESI
jgi:hypothetical protein